MKAFADFLQTCCCTSLGASWRAVGSTGSVRGAELSRVYDPANLRCESKVRGSGFTGRGPMLNCSSISLLLQVQVRDWLAQRRNLSLHPSLPARWHREIPLPYFSGKAFANALSPKKSPPLK